MSSSVMFIFNVILILVFVGGGSLALFFCIQHLFKGNIPGMQFDPLKVKVPATVVGKRTKGAGRRKSQDYAETMYTSGANKYYATFVFESGDQAEMEVPREKFTVLNEGEQGMLTFQGLTFFEFERDE